MSTLIRITISVILFAILFCYEWLHIKKEILNHEKNETFFTEYDYSFTNNLMENNGVKINYITVYFYIS